MKPWIPKSHNSRLQDFGIIVMFVYVIRVFPFEPFQIWPLCVDGGDKIKLT